jgi:hypothetical protein
VVPGAGEVVDCQNIGPGPSSQAGFQINNAMPLNWLSSCVQYLLIRGNILSGQKSSLYFGLDVFGLLKDRAFATFDENIAPQLCDFLQKMLLCSYRSRDTLKGSLKALYKWLMIVEYLNLGKNGRMNDKWKVAEVQKSIYESLQHIPAKFIVCTCSTHLVVCNITLYQTEKPQISWHLKAQPNFISVKSLNNDFFIAEHVQ